MRLPRKILAGIVLGLALAAVPAPASAGASFDFLFSVDHVSDDNQYFLNLAVSNYGYSRAVIEPVLPRLAYVEVDLPVVLFLARESGRPINFIVDLRARGLGWSVVFTKCGVPYDVLFAGIDRDPGPPYGRAWGYWRKNRGSVRLTDADVRGLVQVQMGSRVAGIPAYEVARLRGQGKPVAVVVAEKRGRPYHAAKARGGPPHGKGKPKGHGPHH